jgi:hypothetical protein
MFCCGGTWADFSHGTRGSTNRFLNALPSGQHKSFWISFLHVSEGVWSRVLAMGTQCVEPKDRPDDNTFIQGLDFTYREVTRMVGGWGWAAASANCRPSTDLLDTNVPGRHLDLDLNLNLNLPVSG